jgi:hypothetical protein
VVLTDQTDVIHKGPTPGCKENVQEVPAVVSEFSPGLLGLYGVWHCHDEVVPLLPVGLEVFCELHHEASTELHTTMQNSHFHHSSENELTVLLQNPSITFPADGVILNILVEREGELGYFHCTEARFDSGL